MNEFLVGFLVGLREAADEPIESFIYRLTFADAVFFG